MSKIVPFLAAMGPQALTAMGLGVGSAIAGGIGQRRFQRQQEQANQAWLDFQRQQAARFDEREAANRGAAQEQFMENLDANTVENRNEIIDRETERLGDRYTAALPTAVEETLAGSHPSGRSEVFDEAMARSLAEATADARSRLQALAKAGAYGGGTQFGQGQELGKAFTNAATNIGYTNNGRLGDIGTLRRYQQIQPEIFEYQPGFLETALGVGSQIVGGMSPEGFGSFFGGGGGGAAPAAASAASGASAGPVQFSFMPTAGSVRPRPRPDPSFGWGYTTGFL